MQSQTRVTAATTRLYRRATLPQRLQALAAVAYVVVFAILVATGRPGLGISQGFYVPIILAALGGTVATGVGAGLTAAILYDLGLVLGGSGGSTELATTRTVIHLVTYVAAGAIVGYFAARARLMLRDSLHALEDLLHIARRDLDTGALDARGLEATLTRWIATRGRFSLLVGEFDCDRGDEAGLRQLARVLQTHSEAGAEVARVGPAQFALVTASAGLGEARAVAGELERILDERGCRATFGWATHPAEGGDGLSLFRAASERLYARRFLRGEWTPTPASAGLADELISPA